MLEAYFFAYGRVDAILLGCDGRWAYVDSGSPVSYTHLAVYKRQELNGAGCGRSQSLTGCTTKTGSYGLTVPVCTTTAKKSGTYRTAKKNLSPWEPASSFGRTKSCTTRKKKKLFLWEKA